MKVVRRLYWLEFDQNKTTSFELVLVDATWNHDIHFLLRTSNQATLEGVMTYKKPVHSLKFSIKVQKHLSPR